MKIKFLRERFNHTDNPMNAVVYSIRRNNWLVDPSFYLQKFYYDIKIVNPVFLLGVQGGGLTLISRMLRKNSNIVSVTGNYRYWAGADEMQQVFGPFLPQELTGLTHKPPYHPRLFPPRSWSYASNELLPLYRCTESNTTEFIKNRLLRVIKYSIWRYGRGADVIFTDKSQVYSVKVAFINKLLEGFNPIFVLITRDPYASVMRAAEGKAIDMKHYKEMGVLTREERIKICAEHWLNSYRCALEDAAQIENFIVYRFEDFLRNPKDPLKKICHIIGIPFEKSMIPSSSDQIPLGAKSRDRWYPLNPNVNDPYIKRITISDIDIVYSVCGEMAEKLGYFPPNKKD